MLSAILDISEGENNPIGAIAEIAAKRAMAYKLDGDDKIDITVNGKNSPLIMSFFWQEEFSSLLFACFVPMEISDAAYDEFVAILETINQNMWLGHFDLSGDIENLHPTFRYTFMLDAVPLNISIRMIENVMEIAEAECTRFYETFKQAQACDEELHDNLSAVMFETVGEA